jgi:hypothetical protein
MTAHRSALVSALVLLVAAGAVRATSAQDGALRYRWTQGETMRYRATQAATVTMSNMPGAGDMSLTTNIVQVQQLAVQNVAADGTATIRMTFESVKLDMSTPMGTMSYDSAAPASAGNPMVDMIAKSYGAMVGETITMVVTPSGEIKNIDGLAALAQKMAAGMPQSAGMPGMGSFMTEDSLRTLLEQNYAALPNRVVRPGESWNHNNKIKTAFGTVDTAMTFTLKNVEARDGRQLASLSVAGKNTVTMDGTAAASMPMTMTMGSGTSQGELLIDVKTGRLFRSSVQSTQPMSMNMTAPDGTPVNIDAVTKTTLTVELLEK